MFLKKLKGKKGEFSEERVSELTKNRIKEVIEKLLMFHNRNNMTLESTESIEVFVKHQTTLWEWE
jgi:hypothetical protein